MGSDAGSQDIAERGYILAYAKKAGNFNFNTMALLSAAMIVLFAATGYAPLLGLAVAAACVAYFYYPLKERTPRIGAGQYGIFIDGLGLISWRAVEAIERVAFTSRVARTYELQIHLRTPLETALLADWRKLPIWRLLMKLPWHMKRDNVIRIPLEPFEPPADEIRSKFVQYWDQFR
jgi:hypothetical protein